MEMKGFKSEVKAMKFDSLEKAYSELSILSYLVYIKRVTGKFIFELKNGEIFTMDNSEIATVYCDEMNKIMSVSFKECSKKIRVAADWKKAEDYQSLDEREKFDFIRHETSLEESLKSLVYLTKNTKGRFLTQRDLIDEIAIIYGYLKRKKIIFEVYLGSNYDLCSIVKLSTHRARKYYKLYHHLHERDHFNSSDDKEVYLSPLGRETFETLKTKEIIENRNIINNQNTEIQKLKGIISSIEDKYRKVTMQRKFIEDQKKEIEVLEKEVMRLKASLRESIKKEGFISKIFG